MSKPPAWVRVDVRHIVAADPEHAAPESDQVATEEPLEIRLAGETLAITMRTPGHDHELCAGLLLGEGLISERSQLGSMAHCGRPGEEGWGNTLDVAPGPGFSFDVERVLGSTKHAVTTAACGVCGRRSIDDLLARVGALPPAGALRADVIAALPDELRAAQPVFQRTGGLHAAALASAAGDLLVVREDIGRHNAVDKVIGRLLLDGKIPQTDLVLIVSGRASFEIVQKAVAARVATVVAVSAPSSLAVRTAERANLTLIGFARAGGFNVYTGFERVG